ncbi:yeats-domain-containing protein [Coemansia reversa NRRL 1564]|uniref:Yeats-domain-containing protein n=1 Tax=Coemansia reversa (strain ATCC 12441 / NRRL 1564) TaxID=763665 RepID=A0A2G5BEA5_COERN|nr:yeats-domain-containing protein [Coemansia reversa NRRL 1564]|eukprot:PIA17333.1 yeats-domain-containing protein [Coemansia reversa NRRL 1564]
MVSEAEVVLAVQTRHQPTDRTVVEQGFEYSLRKWSCTLMEGRSRASNATLLPYVKEVEFILHESFDNPHQIVRRPPFRVEKVGWGEFDLLIIVHFVNCSEQYKIIHDLNFQEGEFYEKKYPLIVTSPKAGFLALFNKYSTVSRKTIPARETKARKGPPRGTYSTSQRSQNGSISPYSSEDSGADSGVDNFSDGSGSLSGESKARSISSTEAGSSGRVRKQHRIREGSRPGAQHRHGIEKVIRTRHTSPSAGKPLARAQKDVAATSSKVLRRSPSTTAAVAVTSQPMRGGSGARGMVSAPRPARNPNRRTLPATSSSLSPPTGGSERMPLAANTGIKRQLSQQQQQRRRRISDVANVPAKPVIRKHAAGVGEAARPPSPSLTTASVVPEPPAAVRRTQAIGLSGMRVPKKRTAKPADGLDSHARRIRGEKRRVAEHAAAGRDDDMPSPAKRPRAVAGNAVRKAEERQFSSQSPVSASSSATSLSPPRTHARSQKTPAVNLQPSSQSAAATTSREAFIRERERQRLLGSPRESNGKSALREPNEKPSPRSTKTSSVGGLGILGKAAKSGVAAAKAKVLATEDPSDSISDTPRRRIADISVPKISHRSAPASGMTSSAAPAPAKTSANGMALSAAPVSAKPPPMAAINKDDDVDNTPPSDAASIAAGLALSPALCRKMERISEKAALLNERSLVSFLRLLHSLRVKQEPECAATITEEAVDQVENEGAYSCNLSSLAPEDIDRLWTYMRELST